MHYYISRNYWWWGQKTASYIFSVYRSTIQFTILTRHIFILHIATFPWTKKYFSKSHPYSLQEAWKSVKKYLFLSKVKSHFLCFWLVIQKISHTKTLGKFATFSLWKIKFVKKFTPCCTLKTFCQPCRSSCIFKYIPASLKSVLS